MEFLSDEWIDALDAAGALATLPADLHLVVQQVVLGDDGPESSFVVRVLDGRVSVTAGVASDAEVTFTQDRATALAVATGATSAQAAFMDGRLRVGGDLRLVLDRADELAAVADVFAAARAALTEAAGA